VNINPNLALAQHQLGYLLFRSGQYDVAEEHYRQAVRADPGFTQAWISLAATLATKSKFLEAKEAVAHALRLEPHNAEALEMQKQLATTQAIH
jgi:tetratricopeptide (TPR) repeat protein